MRNLVLALVTLVSGFVTAQDFGSWRGVETDGYYFITTEGLTYDVTFGVFKSKDGEKKGSFLRLNNINLEVDTDVTLYVTVDGGKTFKKAEGLAEAGEDAWISTSKLLALVNTNEFVEADEIWFAVGDEIYKFTIGLDFSNAIIWLSDASANPFNNDNPFQG